jgi:hypothetical protein
MSVKRTRTVWLALIGAVFIAAFSATVFVAVRHEDPPKPAFQTVAIDSAYVSKAPDGVSPGPCEY